MGYKDVADLSADVTVALGGTNKKTGKKNPTSIEGYFLGSRQVADRKKKSGFSYIHIFQTEKGNIGVWGKTDLDNKILTITPGTMTLVNFDRMVPTPNGDMYKFKVQFDADNTIEVAAPSTALAATAGVKEAEESSDELVASANDDEDSVDEELTDGVDEDLAQEAALAALERQARAAKVAALLKNGKAKAAKN
jgi:hypothetical protein